MLPAYLSPSKTAKNLNGVEMGAAIPPRGICSLKIVTEQRSKECSIGHILKRLWLPVI
jgi:hypothetical protein